VNRAIEALAAAVDSEAPREQRAHEAAQIVKDTNRVYRWVGIYDVGDDEIVLISDTGKQPPARVRLGVEAGLCGQAVRTRATVATGSEVIVPILGAESGIVIGTLNVEGDRVDAFAPETVGFLEECAAKLRPLYD
jgi:putative methionine-R-sulfoxide reductase with GAF domain